MPQTFDFDSGNALGDGLGRLPRPELLSLCRELCRILAAYGGCHGNVHRASVSLSPQGKAGLDAPWSPDSAWTPDQLEFMAPELFWNHAGSPASDVYSLGLLLYAGVNGGALPFAEAEGGDASPEARAASVRRRMSGDAFEIPAAAGEKLGEVIAKCLAFDAEGRYADPAELLTALDLCPDAEEPCAGPAAAIPASGAAAAAAETDAPAPEAASDGPEYKVDKDFEDRVPPKPKRRKGPVIVVFCICAALILLALALKSFGNGGTASPVTATPDAYTGGKTPAPASASPAASAQSLIHIRRSRRSTLCRYRWSPYQ